MEQIQTANPLTAARMKMQKNLRVVLALLGLAFSGPLLQAQVITSNLVTAVPNTAYRFNNASNNPTLTLFRQVTYLFNIQAGSLHPFYIKSNATFVFGSGNQYTNGVTGNGTHTGFLTFAVPTIAPNQLFYHCGNHDAMSGTLNISNAPAPPTGEVVLVSLTESNVTMQSLGAINWKVIPEFSSNILSGVWATVPGFTNILADGTNITSFGRLDAICGPDVFLRVRNTFPP